MALQSSHLVDVIHAVGPVYHQWDAEQSEKLLGAVASGNESYNLLLLTLPLTIQ
jgi:hypothetical protein